MLRDIRHDTQQISAAVEQLQDRAATVDDLEERRLLFKWLEPNPASVEDNLNEALKQHHPGTGKWLLESDAYKRWSKGPIGLLWIHGIRKWSIATLFDVANMRHKRAVVRRF